MESNYTRIPNSVLDKLVSLRIPGEAAQVLMCIIRKTYGFNKDRDMIALSQIVAATGIKKPNVIRAEKKLKEMGVITVIKNDNDTTKTYMITKDLRKWKPLSKKIKLSKAITSVIKKDNLPLSKAIPTKESITKEKKEKELKQEKFDSLWKIYGRGDKKVKAKEKFMKLNLKNGDYEQMIRHAEWQRAYQLAKGTPHFIPHMITYLNQEIWKDDIPDKLSQYGRKASPSSAGNRILTIGPEHSKGEMRRKC